MSDSSSPSADAVIVRKLTWFEKIFAIWFFPEGNIWVAWYGAFDGPKRVALTDDLKRLVTMYEWQGCQVQWSTAE